LSARMPRNTPPCCSSRNSPTRIPGLRDLKAAEKLAPRRAEEVRHRAGFVEGEKGGVDPVHERGAVPHEVEAANAPARGPRVRRSGEPDRAGTRSRRESSARTRERRVCFHGALRSVGVRYRQIGSAPLYFRDPSETPQPA
jgi:hypothetical protein